MALVVSWSAKISACSKEDRSSAEPTLKRLEQLAPRKNTIADQLESMYGGRGGEFTVSLASPPETQSINNAASNSASRRRNARRQEYMDKVSRRDDTGTFATIGFIVLVPPLAILAAAIASGYIQLLP